VSCATILLLRGTLAANHLRLALTVACIALGVALGGAVHTIHASALAEIDRAARTLAGSADLEVRGPRSGFDERLLALLAKRPEVRAASPVVEIDALIAGQGEETLRVLGIDPLRAAALQPAFALRAPADGWAGASARVDAMSAWLSPGAAARLGLHPGAQLRLASGTRTIELHVEGTLAGLDAAGELAVIDIATAQDAFGRLGTLSRIDLRLAPGVDAERFRPALAALLPPGVVVTPPASIAERAATITRAYRVNLDALALVALATGAFLVFSTLALQAARRRQEFAVLRALGVTRRGLAAQLALEGALIGALGAALGTVLGLAGSRMLLQRAGGDLGAGYFGASDVAFAPDPVALGAVALLGIAMSVAAALWVARAAGRVPVAEALHDRAIDLPAGAGAGRYALACLLVGIPLLAAPPVAGLPIAGYAAIAAWLAAAVLAVGPLCRWILARAGAGRSPVASLALAQVRHLPGHLAASVGGIVVSASLCAAMAIMVHSFRVCLEDWLAGIVGADLYVGTASTGDSGFLTEAEQRAVAELPGVASAEALRFDRLATGAGEEPLTLIARPINARILDGYQAEPRALPPPNDIPPAWINEAARDLHGWKPGERIVLPIAGRATAFRVSGVIRDYARTWGAVVIPLADYRRITGDTRANELAIHLSRGMYAGAVTAAVRRTLDEAPGLQIEDGTEIKRRSLEIFDRSFAVTYALEAIAVAIGLAGVTSSFAALAWSRRREFGVLRFLGLTRPDVLRLLALEGALSGALGAALGLAAGAVISLALVRVVNRQSFHWTIEVHWPLVPLVLLGAAVVALCALGARTSGALAVRHEAVAAVKDDA
jgi:putative ABC transport system permease protein